MFQLQALGTIWWFHLFSSQDDSTPLFEGLNINLDDISLDGFDLSDLDLPEQQKTAPLGNQPVVSNQVKSLDDAENTLKILKIISRVQYKSLDFEIKYSRFWQDSWVSVLNRNKCVITDDPEFVELCMVTVDLNQKTGGHFYPFIAKKTV